MRERLTAPDILRVLCIGMVAWYHFWQQSWLDPGFFLLGRYVNMCQLVRNGYMFVDVLLVLTGFLLALPYGEGEDTRLGEFYGKRFRRIVPSYWLAVAVTVFLYGIPQGLYSSGGKLVKDILLHLTFTHNLTYETYFYTPIPGVLWTLAVEVQFYALFPLVGRVYKKHPLWACLGLSVIAWGFRAWVYPRESTDILVNQLPAMLDLFAVGMGAAWVYNRLKGKNFRHRWLFVLGAAACLLLMLQFVFRQYVGDYALVRQQQLMRRLPMGLLGGGFLLCGSLARLPQSRVVRFLSDISYNFYIWHQFLAVRLKAWHIPAYTAENPNMAGEQPWQSLYMLACVGAALLAGTAVTYLVEKPCARALNKGRKPLGSLSEGTVSEAD